MFHRKLVLFIIIFLVIGISISFAQERGIKLTIKNKEGQKVGFYKESHALVIGVNDYDNGWPKLPGVLEDIQAVQKALKANGFQVKTIMNPNSDELAKTFEDFIDTHGHQVDNRLLFYYAGHGHTLTPKWGGQPMGYIIPKEAPNPHQDERTFKKLALPLQRIEEYALSIDSKHALFIFDCCFSGSLFAISRAIPENISYKTAKPVRQFITAGSANETVPDISIFRQQFVAALQGEGDVNNDGFLTGTELGEFLQGKVVNYSKGAQHPQYGKIRNPHLDKGDFVFRIRRSEVISANAIKKGDSNIQPPAANPVINVSKIAGNKTPTFSWSIPPDATECRVNFDNWRFKDRNEKALLGEYSGRLGDDVTYSTKTEFTPNTPLAPGRYTLWVRCRNDAGSNETDNEYAIVDVNIQPPAANPVINVSKITGNKTPTFSWSIPSDATECRVNFDNWRFKDRNEKALLGEYSGRLGDDVTYSTKTEFTPNTPLAPGRYTLWVRCRNDEGSNETDNKYATVEVK